MTQGVKMLLLSLNNLSWIAGDPRQCKERSHSLMLFSIFNPRSGTCHPPSTAATERKKAKKQQKKKKQLTVNKTYRVEAGLLKVKTSVSTISGSFFFFS